MVFHKENSFIGIAFRSFNDPEYSIDGFWLHQKSIQKTLFAPGMAGKRLIQNKIFYGDPLKAIPLEFIS